MSKRLLTIGLCLLACPAFLLVGCGKEVRAKAAFHAVAVTAGPGPIGRNEDLVVRFSRPLASGALPDRALVVRDAKGRSIRTTLERDGRHLVIRPPASMLEGGVPLWPLTKTIQIDIPVPMAGPTFRSMDGDELAAGFRTTVAVASGWRQKPGNLEVLSSVPVDGATGVAMDQSIEIQFNAPVEANSLVSGLQLIDHDRKVLIDVLPTIDRNDPRKVVIDPFASTDRRDKGRSLLNAGGNYSVVVTRALRSRDGRTPIERSVIRFQNEAEGPRHLRVSFSEQSDFADESRESFDPMRLSIRPQLRRDFVTSRGDGASELVPFGDLLEGPRPQGASPDPNRPHVFSKVPSRTQILVDGRWLGARPRFVTGIVFRIRDDVRNPGFDDSVYADNLAVSLGYLNPDLKDAAGGLSSDLDINVVDGQTMDLGGEGRVVLEPVPDQPGIVELRFSQPFAYAGGERDMVVEIHNGGVTFGYEHQSWGGLDVLGAQHGEAGKARRTIAFEDDGGRRVASSFVLRYMLRVADNPPIVTRWYRIDDAENPQFITNKNDAYGTADPLDYSLQYQAGTAVLDEAGHPKMRLDGTPDCTATGLWRSRPPAGAKAVRVRIRFDDRWYPSGQEPPEIEYILVRYKEG